MKQTTLLIQDQVNCRFLELDPIVRRKLVDSLKYMVPYARHMPAFKLGRWDGKVSFCTVGGGTYINLLDIALKIVMDAGYEVDIDDRRPERVFAFPEIHEGMLSDRTWPEGHPMAGQPIMLRDYQVAAIKRYIENLQSIQSISTGAGKAQPLWSQIKVPGGWSTMGEMKVGTVVSTPDGGRARVTGVFPQGKKAIYRVTFKDGRTAEACGDHLWTAYCVDWKHARSRGNTPWKTLTTAEIAAHLARSKRPVRVPLAVPEAAPPAALPVDPYILGVMIGDGGLKHQIVISSADDAILDRVSERLDDGYELRHASGYDYRVTFTKEAFGQARKMAGRNHGGRWAPYRREIDALGLNVSSVEKFIPELYLTTANAQQRIELIRGLLDTDGYVGKNGEISFSTSSERLARDFAYLIRSIGGTAATSNKQTFYTHGGERRAGKPSYVVRVRYHAPQELLTLPRKLARIPENYQYADSLRLEITSVEPIGDHPCQCIMIDHPDHLYITDNFVVTHNTILSATLSMICEPHGRTIVIVPNKSLVEQTEEDYRNLGLDVGVFYGDRKEWGHRHTICTWQSLAVFAKKDRREIDFSSVTDRPGLDKFLEGVVCVMVDEVHTAKGNELRSLLCGPMAHIPIRWGLTGTVPKEDWEFANLLVSLGPVVGEIKASDLQEQGVLAKCHVDVVQLRDEHVSFSTYDEEYAYLTSDERRLAWIARHCTKLAESGNTLILVERIECGEFLENHIPNSVFVHGGVKTKDRRKEYREVQSSDNKIIIATYGVAAVGINIPRIFNLVLIEPGKSFVRVIQSIGRGIRKAADKDFVAITDICSTLKYSGRHLGKRKQFYRDANYPHEVRKMSY